jgi:cytochrome c peroxidase
MKSRLFLIGALAFVLGVSSCKKEDTPNRYEVLLPSNFPAPEYNLASNPVTPEGFELGKRLFYDPILSQDSTISCADCHISFSAFSHPDHITSHGIRGQFGKRNAPAIQNLIWQRAFFWDGGVPDMDLISLNPIQNPVEMDEDPANVIRKLNRNDMYRRMFKAAFPGRDTIDGPQMMQAFSQFMAMLVSANSRYDKYVRGESGANLTPQELSGLAVFRLKCSSCHQGDLFTDGAYRNNGILGDFTSDKGRYEVSSMPEDIGKFKTPSLRNVAVTQPYMHNGRFKTLESVMDHYASGVKVTQTLDPKLLENGTPGIPLSSTEKLDLVAFLKTLTDESFIRDERFQQN